MSRRLKTIKKRYRSTNVQDQDGESVTEEETDEDDDDEDVMVQDVEDEDGDEQDDNEAEADDTNDVNEQDVETDSDNMSVDTEVAECHFTKVKGAFTAVWKAKQKTNAKRKARGFTDPSKAPGGGKKKLFKNKTVKKELVTVNPSTLRKPQPAGSDNRSVDERKKNSKSSDCQQKGHWGGDPSCPLVKSGKCKPYTKGAKGKGTHIVELVTSSSHVFVLLVMVLTAQLSV